MKTATPVDAAAQASRAVLPGDERRGDHRLQTVFRVARVITAHDEGLARVRNMSDFGAGISLSLPVIRSETLMLELADGVALHGQVIWTGENMLGLQFDQSIDCRELLATLAEGARCAGLRPVRLPLSTVALTRSERGMRCVKVVDISQRGLKVVHDGSLTSGLHLKVSLPCGLDRHGIVRWTDGQRAGVMLLEPLSVEALGSVRRLLRTLDLAELLPQAGPPGMQR